MSIVRETAPLGFPWPTEDPFLFCVHHDDAYPAGDARLGPASSLHGRNLGQDFAGKDGWRMYHGRVVPGFPQHPHRGFETVTIVRKGFVDHADSLGATARFGPGDVQWLTAGGGIVHSEMFPLLDRSAPNPLELFQIWLNLPGADKMVPAHFSMLWGRDVPRASFVDAAGKRAEVVLVAGSLADRRALAPPPRSWAARADSDVAIWSIALDAKATWTLPPAARADVSRTLYFFRGDALGVGGERLAGHAAAALDPAREVRLEAGELACEVLLLQGRPIGEPVVANGPFVMNSRAEVEQAFADYRRTRFGGWPWPADDPVHPAVERRFARHADGKIERVEE
jgi:redox-sensitive bicupin YhaK (pirin superfamily)